MKIGDQVAYKDEVGGGKIIDVRGQEYLIEEASGFSDWYLKSELLPKIDQDVDSPALNDIALKDSSSKNISKPHLQNHKAKLEVDLHLHAFMENTSGMDNYHKVMAQLGEAKRALNEARAKRFKYLCLIHGKGSGKLRMELHQWLASQNVIDYYDIDISGNRSGVTEVQLF